MANKRLPIIGITCLDQQPTQDQHLPSFGQNQTYVHAVARAGAAPLLIPPLTDEPLLRTLYQPLDGLLLSGGEDVDPAHYGEPRHEKCGPVSPHRDKAELTLTRWAMHHEKPLLAICRGIQVLNVALGGSLYQDIQAQVQGAVKHHRLPGYPRSHLPHTVIVTPQTRLAHILAPQCPERRPERRPEPCPERRRRAVEGPRRRAVEGLNSPDPLYWVNSSHHQAIKDLAPGLTVAARAPDGIVEAVEVQGHPFAIGVQWHPEELADNDVRAQRIFHALVEACQGRMEDRE